MGARSVLALAGVLTLAASGCKPQARPSDDEQAVRAQFAAFQKALDDRDGAALLALLDDEGRAEAERVAASIRDAYAKADGAGKTRLETDFGLDGEQVARLTAAALLAADGFIDRYEGVCDGPVEKVEVTGERAVVTVYDEEEERPVELTFVRRNGAWRLSVRVAAGP